MPEPGCKVCYEGVLIKNMQSRLLACVIKAALKREIKVMPAIGESCMEMAAVRFSRAQVLHIGSLRPTAQAQH